MPRFFAAAVLRFFTAAVLRFVAAAVLRFFADTTPHFFAVCPRNYGPRAQIPAVGRNFTDWVCRHTSFQRLENKRLRPRGVKKTPGP